MSKTHKEHQKAYRDRKRDAAAATVQPNDGNLDVDTIVVAPSSSSGQASKHREAQKKYKDRLRALKPKPNPKSTVQRSKEYRARMKYANKVPLELLSQPCASTSAVPSTRVKPTTATSTPATSTPASLTPATPRETQPHFPAANELVIDNYEKYPNAHDIFKKKFVDNHYGAICSVCDRLWFENDMKKIPPCSHAILLSEFPDIDFKISDVCSTCFLTLKHTKIPNLSKSNGFVYPQRPPGLPELDVITERLISPRLPFMQIRRLRHGNGQYGILGQVINVPVEVNTMINLLPRELDDDFCITVHIKKKKVHRSSYLIGMIKKRVVKAWLRYLIDTPLYKFYKIKVNESFFNNQAPTMAGNRDEFSEEIEIEESLTAQQHTLLWNEDMYLRIAPGENTIPQSILFDEHCEELAFPSIYFGHFRKFKEGVRVTPFMMATSELRRADRRGVIPNHVLYMAMKIMRIRTRDSLQIAFKFIGKNSEVTRAQVESADYINGCIENNLAFLRHIPNSAYYWASRKRDLFAMIRQFGKPTFFLTMSANEIGWTKLMKMLYKFKNKGEEIDDDRLRELHYNNKATLINEDPVTCAVYFNKIIDCIMGILKSKRFSPFGANFVSHYFKRIEFQHRGSPHAHLLLWLNKAPNDALGVDKSEAIALIDRLVSVSAANASGHIKLQTHKHTFTCYKKIGKTGVQKCRFDAPFMPSRDTIILLPMPKTDARRPIYAKLYNQMWKALEENDYGDINHFFREHKINSDEFYMDVLRAGISRPKVFLKRQPSEKWINPFNSFILSVLGANTDIQYITEEYSCAAYVVEYVNKTNRGISNLQRKIIETMDEHPEFDIVEITRKLSIDLLNSVEITSQEAAWYLLRLPMSWCSTVVVYVPTCWPIERQRLKKSYEQMDKEELDEDATSLWKENWFDKYEKRPADLEELTLAQAASQYLVTTVWKKRRNPRVLRYRNYDMVGNPDEYKREMVTLHIPFRNEEMDILAERKFMIIYEENEMLILQRRKEFESDLDIQKTIQICREMCIGNDDENDGYADNLQNLMTARVPEPDPFADFYNVANAEMNKDITMAILSRLGAVAKKRENIMAKDDFNALMRQCNSRQHGLLMHVIHRLQDPTINEPLQVFFTGPAGCGKTYVIRLLMEIYNRFTDTDGYCNAYITCASTGKTAVAIEGTTIHTALKISIGKNHQLSNEVVQQFRTLFKYTRVIIVDEISMVSAELLNQINLRLKQITGVYDINFGGKDIFMIGDLRQLPPVRSTPIWKQPKHSIEGPTVWRGLKFYPLHEVMRQSNAVFSRILTKIGDGKKLDPHEQNLIESRFFPKTQADELCPNGIRLFFMNRDVDAYNTSVLGLSLNKTVSIAKDIFTGYTSAEELAFVRQKLYKMSLIDTNGLHYELSLVLGRPYMITTNIDVADGLSNGSLGSLQFVEKRITDSDEEITRLWLRFAGNPKIGQKTRKVAAKYCQKYNIDSDLVPIARKTVTIYLNRNRTISVKRNHFPVSPACAISIHKSQGGSFDEVVYSYSRNHQQDLVYVALSRVTNIEGLYIVSPTTDQVFYHGRRNSLSSVSLQLELERLASNSLRTYQEILLDFIKDKISIFSFNCQSLRAHHQDLQDELTQGCMLLMLSETRLDNRERIDIPNFDWVYQLKRETRPAGGVAIYRKRGVPHIITPHIMLYMRQTSGLNVAVQDAGDICSAHCRLPNGRELLAVVVYISPNQSIQNIIDFLHFVLLPYSEEGAALLKKQLHLLPMILSGDFNVNFKSPDGQKLITFLHDTFDLTLNSSIEKVTTQGSTTIDGVFQRKLNNLQSEVYASYFSYHKSIISAFPAI